MTTDQAFSAPAASAPGIEYMIYVFGQAQDPRQWKRHATLTDLSEAQRQTDDLFSTGLYKKIEIKQKSFDARRQRHIDTTLKVLEHGPCRRDVATAFFVALCAVLALSLAFFINQAG